MSYIKKEPIIEFITNGLNNPDKANAFGHDAVEILTEIEYAPTADVVEVVRCGKCKHYMVAPISGREFCTINAMKKNNEWHGLIVTKNDHFCGYGERRTDNDL